MFAVGTAQTRRPRASPRTKSSTGVPRVRPPAATICCAATLWEYWPPLTAPRYVYDFDEAVPGGRELLGGKGDRARRDDAARRPRPGRLHDHDRRLPRLHGARRAFPDGLDDEVDEHVARLEERDRQALRRPDDPLLVSVRSGAAVSMPGMMDTILNLGLNDDAVEGLARTTGNARFAYDSYRRLIQMYGEVVEGIDGAPLRAGARRPEVEARRRARHRPRRRRPRGAGRDVQVDLPRGDGRRVPAGRARAAAARGRAPSSTRGTTRARRCTAARTGSRTTSAPRSTSSRWSSATRASDSGTGVCFTRDPSTGEQGLYGEFLANAQGEDVVAGIRTPRAARGDAGDVCPRRTSSCSRRCAASSEHYRDMQDIEFTVEDGTALPAADARREAHRRRRAEGGRRHGGRGADLARGGGRAHRPGPARPAAAPDARPATRSTRSPRRASTRQPGRGERRRSSSTPTPRSSAASGEAVILVRWETTPDDIHGMIAAQGILTVHGGMTSHAAVVARGMGKPCVAGCEALSLDLKARRSRASASTSCARAT